MPEVPTHSEPALWSLVLSDEGQRVIEIELKPLRRFLNEEDLRQAGALGVYRAAERFDPSRGLKFSTYARWWARAEMTAAIECSRPVRVPYATITSRIRDLEQLLADDPSLTPGALAEKLGVTTDRLIDIQNARTAAYVPIEDFSDEAIWVEEQTPESLYFDKLREEAVEEVLLGLPSRVRRILVMYFGLYEVSPKSLEGISQVVGCSEERTRQLLHAGLFELRRHLEAV